MYSEYSFGPMTAKFDVANQLDIHYDVFAASL